MTKVTLVSWNVNSIRARWDMLWDFMVQEPWDVIALQEIKVMDQDFPQAALQQQGWHTAFWGQKTYNGVALISKWPLVDVQRVPLVDEAQARMITAGIDLPLSQVSGFSGGLLPCHSLRIASVYVPNGRDLDHQAYVFKGSYMKELARISAPWIRQACSTVLLGDFNITLGDDDIHDADAWRDKILCSVPERQWLRQWINQGWTDAFYPVPSGYSTWPLVSVPGVWVTADSKSGNQADIHLPTWWPYRTMAWQRQAGLRIDYAWLSPWAADHRCQAGVHTRWRGQEKPSDHAPLWVQLDVGTEVHQKIL